MLSGMNSLSNLSTVEGSFLSDLLGWEGAEPALRTSIDLRCKPIIFERKLCYIVPGNVENDSRQVSETNNKFN